MHWIEPVNQPEPIAQLEASLGLSPFLATLLAQRGLQELRAASTFLNPKLSSLSDPFLLEGMDQAVQTLVQALERQESVLIFGDYDVDGISSSVLLVKVLAGLGLSVRPFVPRRLEEGYGLSLAALQRAFEQGIPDLFIALDCGTNSVQEVEFVRRQGSRVLILDHHQAAESVPEDCILINPHLRTDQAQRWGSLCTVGLVFKLAHALLKHLRQTGLPQAHHFDLRSHLDLVALGTVADLVPLIGENRTLVRFGLGELARTRNVGLRALASVAGLRLGDPIQPNDISFRLGPRINACGRLSDAELPIQLLLEKDPLRALSCAQELDQTNRRRQGIERSVVEEAMACLKGAPEEYTGYVAYNPEWHPGVVGIAAGQLTRHFHRPCIVLGAEGDMARGSGRSVPGVDLVAVLTRCDHLLGNWGGHPMAVGLSLPSAHVPAFSQAFHQAIQEILQGPAPEASLEVAYWLSLEEIGPRLLQDLDQLQPFGQGNPEPVLGIKGLRVRPNPQSFGEGGQHLRLRVEDALGRSCEVTAWKTASRPLPIGKSLDLAVRINPYHWNGQTTLQITLADWRLTK